MTKKLLPLLGGLFIFAMKAHCAGIVKENGIETVGAASSVAVSTFAWTRVPTSAVGNLAQRSGVIVDVPSSSTGTLLGIMSNSTTAPTVSTTTRPIEIKPADNPATLEVGPNVYLWFVNSSTYSESIHYQEFSR